MWKNGSTAMRLSRSVMARHRLSVPFSCTMLATRLRCVSITPFDTPVVPLEYGRATRSCAGSIFGRFFGSSSSAAISSAKGVEPAAPSNVKISSTPPATSAASFALSRKAPTVMRKRAFESRSWLASSSAV
jgi:hypothetical protein